MIKSSSLFVFVLMIFAVSPVFTQDYTGYSKLADWKIQSWKGQGSGTYDAVDNKITLKGGAGMMDQTVAVLYKPSLKIEKDGYLRISLKLKSEDLGNFAQVWAAVRKGGLKDLTSRKLSGSFDWREVAILLHPSQEVSQATYIAVRLYGSGTLSIKDFTISKLDKKTADELAKKEAAELKLDRTKRIGKLMQSYQPSLPLNLGETVRQFASWGTERPAFPPVPSGWKEVSRPDQEKSWAMPPISEQQLQQNGGIILKEAKDGKMAGYVFHQPSLQPVSLDTQAGIQNITMPLRQFATPGEFEPVLFSVRALKDLRGVRVKLDKLESPNVSIGSKQIDIRTVGFIRIAKDQSRKRFYHEPFLLEKGPDFIDKYTSRRYWVTVKVPDNAAAGIYKGEIELKAEGIASTKIPVLFRVLPFKLPQLDAVMNVWWSGHRFKRSYPVEKELIDQKEHGMSTMLGETHVPNRDGKVDAKDIQTMAKDIDELLRWHKEIGFSKPMIGGHSNHYIVFKWNKKINWFKMDSKSPSLDKEFLSVYRRLYLEEGKKRNWPEIWHYAFDEPGGARPEILPDAAHYLKLLKENFPQLKTFVTFGGGLAQGYDEIKIIGPYIDYWSINRYNPDIAARFKKHGKKVMVYNGGTSTFNGGNVDTRRNRFFYGVYAEKIGAEGVGQWTYAFDYPFKVPFAANHGFVYPGKDGPLPSTFWENIREGIDDRRYLKLLKEKIAVAVAEKAGKAKLVKDARNLLSDIMSQVSDKYQTGSDTPEADLSHFDYGIFDRWRWAIADQIMKLDGDEKGNVAQAVKDDQSTTLSIKPFRVESSSAAPFSLPDKRNGKAYKMSKTPVIDGVISEGEWDDAGVLDDFTYAKFILSNVKNVKRGYQAAPMGQKVRIGYDKDNFFLAFENPLPDGAKPKTLAKFNDGQVWADDSVECFIKPGMGPSPYWVLIANSANKWLDGKERNNKWNGKWERRASIAKDKWICEIKFPCKNLDFAPSEGTKMLMNFFRSDFPNGKYACWSPIKKGAHEPESFGLVEFAGSKPKEEIKVVRLNTPPLLRKGLNDFALLIYASIDQKALLTAFLTHNGQSSKFEKTIKLKLGQNKISLPFELSQNGKYDIKLELKGKNKSIIRSYGLTFSGKSPINIELKKNIILTTDKTFECKAILNLPELLGKKI